MGFRLWEPCGLLSLDLEGSTVKNRALFEDEATEAQKIGLDSAFQYSSSSAQKPHYLLAPELFPQELTLSVARLSSVVIVAL